MELGYQTCVMCKSKIETKNVISTLECTETDLDSRPKGVARLAEKNFVNFCDSCGYANFNLEFDVTEGNREVLGSKEYQEIFHNDELPTDAKKFYLQGLILESIEQYLKAAFAYLRAAWFFNDSQNKEWMIKSRKKTIDCLLNYECTFTNVQTYSVLVDCYRRIGDFESCKRAIKSFDKELIKEDYYRKLFNYELILCDQEDTCAHSSKEVNEKDL